MAGTPVITRPLKFAVAWGGKTSESRSYCLRSMEMGKRSRVCWMPVWSAGDGLLGSAYSVGGARQVPCSARNEMQVRNATMDVRILTGKKKD